MRYVPVNQLRRGMVLGRDITAAAGQVLLPRNTEFNEENIAYVAFLGVPGVHVDDEFSRDVEIREVVKPELLTGTVRTIHEFYDLTVDKKTANAPAEKKMLKGVESIVDSILSEDSVMYNMSELKTYDDYTYFHSANVAILSGILGSRLGLSRESLKNLIMAGFLHDVGKLFIDPQLLNIPRRLTESERIRMMDHPRKGYEFLKEHYDFPEEVLETVFSHHEWFNGSGYPRGKAGEDIPIGGRIMKVADVYDAMTTKRPYHPAFLPSEVMEYIMARSGLEFDPQVVDIMSQEICVYPVGCEVELSNKRRGIVVENHRGSILRPTVKMLDNDEEINLTENKSAFRLTITRLMV